MQRRNIEAIVIGGSAGALDVLLTTLSALPAGFPLPIAIAIHLPPGKPTYLSQVLAAKCRVDVKEAEDKEPLRPATVYVAPPDYHLLIERRRCFALSVDAPIHFSRPAIDVLFESAADAYGPALAGALLTGANEDGALGLLRISEAGGLSLVQTPDSAVARAMPEAALRLLRPDHLFVPGELAALLEPLAPSPVTRVETQ